MAQDVGTGGAAVTGRRVRWRSSLRTRIALASGLITLVFMLAVTLATAWYLRQKILDTARTETRESAQATARGLAENLRSITVATQQLARTATGPELDRAQLRWIQRATIQAVPGASGTMLALEPRQPGQAPYTVYIGERNRIRDFDQDDYDYRAQEWYQRTLASGTGWWSEPRFSETAGDVWMVTYNLPLRRPARGMASLDMKLADLVHPIAELGKRPGTEVILLAPAGTITYSSIDGVALNNTLEEYLRRSGRGELGWTSEAMRSYRAEGRADTEPGSGLHRFSLVEPVANTGWVLLVSQTYGAVIGEFNRALALLVAMSLVLTLLGTFAVRRLARQISRPLEQLTRSAVKAIAGHDPAALPHQDRPDEVGLLARTLEQARLEIGQQMEEIEAMVSARQKLESELSIARDIQRAMLPDGRSVGQGRQHVEARALLEAAKTVGGDFYNFIEREGRLWFVIGDVSDKGVPAALFMARAVTVLEVAIQTSATPAQALAEASRRLVEGNETCMFATVLCGCIEVGSGALSLASAGHDPPLLVSADGTAQVLELENGPPLGFEVSEDFALWHGALAPGDCLLAYTDGATEAFNPDEEAYGLERLLTLAGGGLDADQACARILRDVQEFAAGAPPSDDLTLLLIQRTGGPGGLTQTRKIKAPAPVPASDQDGEPPPVQAPEQTPENVIELALEQTGDRVHVGLAHALDEVLELTDAVEALLRRHGASDAVCFDAQLVIEEVATNAVAHAVSEAAPLETIARVQDRRLHLEFRDHGHPFDPTAPALPDLDAVIDERPVGGLGIYMVQQLAETLEYQRVDDCNILRVTLRLDAAPVTESTA